MREGDLHGLPGQRNLCAGEGGDDALARDDAAEAAAVVDYRDEVLLQERVYHLVVAGGYAERRAEIPPHEVAYAVALLVLERAGAAREQ